MALLIDYAKKDKHDAYWTMENFMSMQDVQFFPC